MDEGTGRPAIERGGSPQPPRRRRDVHQYVVDVAGHAWISHGGACAEERKEYVTHHGPAGAAIGVEPPCGDRRVRMDE
eukprot:gene23590-34959_t